ncbi:hypothetical protein Gorai_015885, partial [Gossypium raimondii]|nr:hypothetical protein [Gossypium raimondii]
EIDLRLDYVEDTLPALLFTCYSLLALTLEAKCFQGSKIEVSSDVCLGNLKALYLTSLVLFGDSIHRLISNCHVLQDLAFTEFSVANASGLNIQSPSLKELLLLRLFSIDHVVVINAPNRRFRNYAVAVNFNIPGHHLNSSHRTLEIEWIGTSKLSSMSTSTSHCTPPWKGPEKLSSAS